MFRTSLGLLIALAVVATACGDSSSEPTVSFGEGDIPAAFPSDLPLPTDAVVGSTLVDEINDRSEFEFRTRTGMTELVRLLTVALVNNGYVVESSEGSERRWGIEYRRGGVTGEYELSFIDAATTQGVVGIEGT